MITRISTEDREAWKALRSKYIGGSDAAAVVGLNPFSSPYSLWAEKTGKVPPFEGNLTTDVGTFLEEFVARKFSEISGKKVRRVNQSLINDRYPFAIANIDRDVVGEDSGLECKSTSALSTKRFLGGEFPTNYYCQCVHYLGVTEKSRWYLAVLVGNKEFKIYQITRLADDPVPVWCESSVYVNDDEISALMTSEMVFWYEHVQKDIPPALDGTAATTEAISQVFSESDSETDDVDLFAFESDLEARMTYASLIKDCERKRDEIDNRIKAYLGESSGGISRSYKVSFASQTRESFDSKSFMRDHPGMDLSKYKKHSSFRAFKVSTLNK